MKTILKIAVACGLFTQTAGAFSLLGPYDDWMQPTNGFPRTTDIGGPMNLGEEYRARFDRKNERRGTQSVHVEVAKSTSSVVCEDRKREQRLIMRTRIIVLKLIYFSRSSLPFLRTIFL